MNGIRDLEIKQDNLLYKLIFLSVISGIVAFCFYPIYQIIRTSFIDNGEFTLKFYHGIFKDNYQLLFNSLKTSFFSALITSILGSFIAFYMIFSGKIIKKFYYYLLMLSMISPPFIFGISYIMLFGRRGLITYKILGLHMNPYGLHGIVMLQILGEVSFAAFMLYEIFKNVDYSLIAASRSLGATPWETVKRVILPLSVSPFVGVFFIIFTKSLADFGSAIIIGGRESTLATEAYLTVIGEGNMQKAAAMTLLLIIPALIAFLLYRKILLKNSSFFSENKKNGLGDNSFEIPFLLKLVLGLAAWLFVVIVLLQYGTILFSGFYNSTSHGIEFTLEYLEKFKMSGIKVFVRTIIYAFIAGFFSAIIGILIAYYNRDMKGKFIKVVEFFATLPYIIPGTFFGLGYILAFHSGWLVLTGTAAIVILNCLFRQVSIGIKTGDAILEKINPNIEKAARDLGAGKMNIFIDIILPALKPAFLISFINCFIATMTTIGAVIFLISPGANVATVLLFNYVAQGEYGVASIVAIAITLITFTLNVIVSKAAKRI